MIDLTAEGFKKMLNDLASQGLIYGVNLTAGDIILNLLMTFILSSFIYYVYKKTYSGVLYSKNFNLTLVLVSMAVSTIMMGIMGNLALSLGMVGALSIVRFRTAIKDPRDVSYLFWAISTGIINGVSLYKLSIVSTLVITLVVLLLSKISEASHMPYLLLLKYSSVSEKKITKIMKEKCEDFRRLNTTATSFGNELTFEVQLKEEDTTDFVDALKSLKGIRKVVLFAHDGEVAE